MKSKTVETDMLESNSSNAFVPQTTETVPEVPAQWGPKTIR